MAKMELDTILRCANADCCHNRDGYNCICNIITLNSEGQCALCKPKPVPNNVAVAQNKTTAPFDYETSK